jgi:hypothetical protein
VLKTLARFMRDAKNYQRIAWTDRFNTPTVEQLRASMPSNVRPVFDSLRTYLGELENTRESFAWHGDCWRWTLEYHSRLSSDPLAVIVPCPTDLQLAMPVSREFFQSLPMKRLKRAIRDGLELAQEPFDSRWGIWSVNGTSLLDDLQDLVEMKLNHLAKRVG